MKLIREIREKLLIEQDCQMRTAIMTCLAIAVDRQADSLSSLTRWQSSRETNSNTFGRQALPMIWDFSEPVSISNSAGSFSNAVGWISAFIDSTSCMKEPGNAQRASAIFHPLPNDSANALITDPPYYDAIAYGDLSDFFYVRLKRTLNKSIYIIYYWSNYENPHNETT